MVVFVTEFVIFLKTSKYNELKENGSRMEENQKYFFLPYVLDLINILEQFFCRDSNLRVKLMYESVK